MLPVIIREAREDELRLVYSAWIGTQKHSRMRKLMHPKLHDEGLHRLIERVLRRTSALVAEYEGIVVGFAVVEDVDGKPPIVHYVFTKEPYQKQGVAQKLLGSMGLIGPGRVFERVTYTHAPEPWRNITPPSSWVYDPWAAWAPEE